MKILNKIKLLLRIKFAFDLPRKKKILLYDEIHASAFKDIIKKDFNILELRENKTIYFWIYIKQIFLLDFSFFTYSKNYIKFTKPKVIITFNDARFEMYKLKNSFNDINFITIVNGIRTDQWFKKNQKINPYYLKCDYFFVLNKYFIPKYKKIIESKYHILGHFRNNMVRIGKTIFHKQFLFISQVHDSFKTGKDYYQENYHKKLLIHINEYLTKHNKKLHILLRRSKKDLFQEDEINFYKKIFKANCIFHESTQWKKKYQILDRFENIIFTFSTMGYEAIGRKKKVAIFTPNKLQNKKYYFGWPEPRQDKYGFFSAQNTSYREVERILKNVTNCSQAHWNKKYYNIVKDQFHFNKDNKSIRKLILKLTKN